MPARPTPYLIALATLMAACGGPAGAGPSPVAAATPTSATPTPSPAPTPSPTPTRLPAGAVRFTVAADRSLATIRVREQIADVPLPGDAVLTASAFTGGLVLLPDGSFAPGSTIAIELDGLKSDSALRDEWIKINTLQTRRYPRAEFTAKSVAGIPLPLPATGEWQAQLTGTMTIKGVDREMAWPLAVTRSAGHVRAKGTTTFRFGDFGMAVPANRMILSVVDEVRLELDVTAKE